MNNVLRRTGTSFLGNGQWASVSSVARKDVEAILHEVTTTGKQDSPTIVLPGQAFVGDYRSTSALGVGDGIGNHTAKWQQRELGGTQTSPMEYIQTTEPIKVHGLVVASTGSDHPGLGCPVEYINLKGTTRENPAVCKYTGNRFYSDSWKEGGAH